MPIKIIPAKVPELLDANGNVRDNAGAPRVGFTNGAWPATYSWAAQNYQGHLVSTDQAHPKYQQDA